ncbi:MAG: hypothetical protein KDK48_06680 [Chlamydiia bacterium]|nr:hypothetical protein [Chlamydiia bacterium]
MTKPLPFRVATPDKEPPFQASKWLQLQMLLDPEEMADLLHELDPRWIAPLGKVLSASELTLTPEAFLESYVSYIKELMEGKPSQADLAVAFAEDARAFCAFPVQGERYLLKLRRPAILVTKHTLDYSPDDGKFRSMVRGSATIAWGVELKYPQLFMDPDSGAIVKPLQEGETLFKKAQRWVRQNTLPTDFIAEGKKVTSPVRIGKKALKWVDRHPDLIRKGIKVRHDREHLQQ